MYCEILASRLARAVPAETVVVAPYGLEMYRHIGLSWCRADCTLGERPRPIRFRRGNVSALWVHAFPLPRDVLASKGDRHDSDEPWGEWTGTGAVAATAIVISFGECGPSIVNRVCMKAVGFHTHPKACVLPVCLKSLGASYMRQAVYTGRPENTPSSNSDA